MLSEPAVLPGLPLAYSKAKTESDGERVGGVGNLGRLLLRKFSKVTNQIGARVAFSWWETPARVPFRTSRLDPPGFLAAFAKRQ